MKVTSGAVNARTRLVTHHDLGRPVWLDTHEPIERFRYMVLASEYDRVLVKYPGAQNGLYVQREHVYLVKPKRSEIRKGCCSLGKKS